MLPYNIPSPLEYVNHPVFREKNLHVHVKRDDLIHPEISGNKYRKLKYNLRFMLENKIQRVITFGGAFSNHVHATAALCHAYGITSAAIIRGEECSKSNPTLQFCLKKGMKLHFVSRTDYREKTGSPAIRQVLDEYPDAFIIPEGGSNPLALQGVSEIWAELSDQMDNMPDFLFASAGTGATLAGLLTTLPPGCRLVGFSSLKTDYLKEEIIALSGNKNPDRFTFFTDYHQGGYAKTNPLLLDFIHSFENETGIPIDPVYNAKALFGFFDLIEKNYFPRGSTIVWLHTGGLQGKYGYEYLSGK